MILFPDFVFDYLIKHSYIGKTRTLIIGENYPKPNYAASYFYRSLPNCPGGPAKGKPPDFLKMLCDRLLIPTTDLLGQPLSEYQRLRYFLNSGFLVIDAQPNGIKPITNTPILTPDNLNKLICSILLINPENIIVLTNNNINVIAQIAAEPEAGMIIPKIVINAITGSNVLAFPSAPANPNHFLNQINKLRGGGFNI